MSTSSIHKQTADNLERKVYANYSVTHAASDHLALQQFGYRMWEQFNREHYRGRLKLPHLEYDTVPARNACHFSATTGHGAPVQMGISPIISIHPDERLVRRPFPDADISLVLADCVLKMTVQQACLELPESRQRGITAECNRLGAMQDLPEFAVRRQGPRDRRPVIAHWPFAGRPEDYYGDGITPRLNAWLRGLSAERPRRNRRLVPPPSLSAIDRYHRLLVNGQLEKLRLLLERLRDLGEALREGRLKVLAAVEAGKVDADGNALPGDTPIDPKWLLHDNRAVARLVEGIYSHRSFVEMPILGDALVEAGCDNEHLIRHCHAYIEHTHNCFVLRRLMKVAKELPVEARA